MRFQHVHEAVHFRPWFISAAGYASVAALLEKAESGSLPGISADGEGEGFLFRARPKMTIDGNRIATIHVVGVLGSRLTGIEKTCGNTDYGDIRKEIDEARGMGARGIFLKIDSPGGMVTGCHECAVAIATAGVPVVVFTESQALSAAYYLAAGADSIVASHSADVGYIGVIRPWIDKDKLWDTAGLKYHPIVNEGATLKGIGSGPSLTEEQRNFLQEEANQKGAQFRKHVEDHRVIDDVAWQAGWYSNDRALELGFIDFVADEQAAYGVLLSKIPLE